MGKKRIKTIESDKIKQSKAKRFSTKIPKGRIYIKSTYNNTLITLTDAKGEIIAWSSAGSLGFKGAKKATAYAASIVVKNVLDKVANSGLKEVEVYVNGIGTGRDSAIRALPANNLEIVSIQDITPIPHGGCRQRKPRRV